MVTKKGGDTQMSDLGNKAVFAQNLSYYVERSGKTQKEIAEMLNVSPASFNNWIKGVKYPRIDKIEMLSNYFGILKSDLIEEKKEAVTNNGNGLSESKRQLLALAESCTEEDAEKLLQMMQILLGKQ